MKPRVLALDFDGTIAEHHAINSDAAAAIREARGAARTSSRSSSSRARSRAASIASSWRCFPSRKR
jgi:hypothetical protein